MYTFEVEIFMEKFLKNFLEPGDAGKMKHGDGGNIIKLR